MVMVDICKSVEVETEVNVDVDDITAALAESLDSVTERYAEKNEQDTAKARELMGFINSVAQCLKAVTDEMIADTRYSNRDLIANALREQAQRWSKST